MRPLLLILAFTTHFALAQPPQGKLFFFSGSGGVPAPYLGYIEYPQQMLQIVDSVQVFDIAADAGKVFAAAYLDILIYDTSDLRQADTVQDVDARNIAVGGGIIAAASTAHPYFRVYDVASRNLIFSLDSFKIPFTPSDVLISGDTAFALRDSAIAVISLISQDTIAIVATPHPFPFAGYNTSMADAGDDVYINVEYATGALRFSLLKMNKTTFVVQTLFHNTGNGNYDQSLVIAVDKIYMLQFDSHYDITLDSLFISAFSFPAVAVALDYDVASGAIFLAHQQGISYFSNGSFSDTVAAPGYIRRAVFVAAADTVPNSIGTVFEKRGTGIKIFPNPFEDVIHVQAEQPQKIEKLQLYDMQGRLINTEVLQQQQQFSATGIRDGIYFLKIITRDQSFSFKVVKQKTSGGIR